MPVACGRAVRRTQRRARDLAALGRIDHRRPGSARSTKSSASSLLRKAAGSRARFRPSPAANPGIDVVFPVLHGTFGEDGTVQGLLELADLPYVGAGVLASAVSMDKEVTKRLLVERGLPVAEYVTVTRGHQRQLQPSVSAVRQAGESGFFGRHLEGENVRRAAGRAGARRPVRPQDPGGARHRGTRVRMLGAGQRTAAWPRSPARSSRRASFTITKTSICWMRPSSSCPRRSRPSRPRRCSVSPSPPIRRSSAKAWRASIF